MHLDHCPSITVTLAPCRCTQLLQSCDDDGRATSKNSDAARSHGSSATE